MPVPEPGLAGMLERVRISQWFSALQAGDWQAHWALYAPDALLLVGPQILPRHAVEPALYQGAMTTMVERLRGTDHPELGLIGYPEVKGDTVLATVREARSGVTAKAAFVCGRDGIRAMVVNPVANLPIMAQAGADLAQVPGKASGRQMYLSPLHHSFARRLRGLAGPVRALPEARFTCQGRGECCQIARWDIMLSDNELQAVRLVADSTKGLAVTTKEPTPPPGFNDPYASTRRRPLLGRQDGACHQLDAKGRCSLHARLGFQPIPVCQTYPLAAARTPDGWDVTAHFTCRTVCENQGALLADQEASIKERFWSIQHQVARIPDLLPAVGGGAIPPTVPWEIYRWLEGELLDILAAGQHDLDAALLKGNRRFLAALGKTPSPMPVPLTAVFRAALADLPTGESWKRGWLGGCYWEAWEAERGGHVRFVADPDLLVRYLRAVLFRKMGLDVAGIGLPWGATLLAYRMVKADACFRAWRDGRDATSREDLLEAIREVDLLFAYDPVPQRLSAGLGGTLESPGTWDHLVRD